MNENIDNKTDGNDQDIIKKLNGLYGEISYKKDINYIKKCIAEAIQEIRILRNRLESVMFFLGKELFGESESKKEQDPGSSADK